MAASSSELGAEQEIVQWMTNEIGRAFRAQERHRPNSHNKCVGCATQLSSVAWPCRIFRLATVAVERMAKPKPVPDISGISWDLPRQASERPFRAAIDANATSETVPMRAVPRTASTASGAPAGRHRSSTKEVAKK